MTTATLEPRRPAHTREPIHAPAPVQSPAAAPTDAPSPTPAHSPSTPTARPRHPFDDTDLPPWTAPTHPAPLPASDSTDPAAHSQLSDPITPMQRWAHELVLEIIRANLPLEALAAQLGIPFTTLIAYLHLPEVQTEIDAYEELLTIRARLLGHTARPVSLRKLLDILESPAPRLTHHNPEADQRTLHRHAELIRRTATTITRESRALAPKPAPKPAPESKSAHRTASVSERISSSRATDPLRVSASSPHLDTGTTLHIGDSSSASPFPSPTLQAAGDLPDPVPASTINDANSPDAEDAPRCASPDTVDAPRPLPTGSTGPVDPSAHAPQPAPAPSDSSSPSAPLPLSPYDPSFLSPPRDSASSAASAFSSRSRRTRDHPAPAA